jgi:predicted negative regulator of RcsB-dependent stress response
MEIYRTEQEQIDQLKKIWKQYGLPILVGIVLALALSYGWKYWQNQQETYREQASLVYLQLLNQITQDNGSDISAQADKLMTHYKTTPYASWAAMILAKQAVLDGKLDEAEAKLHWVQAHAHESTLKQLAILRLARVYIAQHKSQQALDLLAKQEHKIFASYAEEIRGDALLELKKDQQARQAYAKALELNPEVENTQPLLQMKYDAIPTVETDK